jgi:hypothetical protein
VTLLPLTLRLASAAGDKGKCATFAVAIKLQFFFEWWEKNKKRSVG